MNHNPEESPRESSEIWRIVEQIGVQAVSGGLLLVSYLKYHEIQPDQFRETIATSLGMIAGGYFFARSTRELVRADTPDA